MTLQEMLFELEEADGAILVWQVEEGTELDWWAAVERKEIIYDESEDTFVHPHATYCEGGGYMIDRRADG